MYGRLLAYGGGSVRLIDADMFYDRLNDMTKGAKPCVCKIIDMCMTELDNQPIIEPKRGKWIACSERLPKENDSYLVTWEIRAINQCFTGSSRFTNGKWETMFGTCEVIAWQPKPEPWEGEE